MITTAASQFELRIWLKVSSPLIPGNHTSSRTQPYARCSIAFKHSSPEATASALKPSSRSTALKVSRIPRSSSTIRIDSDIDSCALSFVLCALRFEYLYSDEVRGEVPATKHKELSTKH